MALTPPRYAVTITSHVDFITIYTYLTMQARLAKPADFPHDRAWRPEAAANWLMQQVDERTTFPHRFATPWNLDLAHHLDRAISSAAGRLDPRTGIDFSTEWPRRSSRMALVLLVPVLAIVAYTVFRLYG